MRTADDVQHSGGNASRWRLRFTLKRLLALTLAACVALAIAFGPRRYTATAYATFRSHPRYAQRHPRFVQYAADGLSDDEIVSREAPHILDSEFVAHAAKLLAKAGVSEADLGGDAARWFADHVDIESSNRDYILIRVSARQSWYAGRANYRRETLAWKALGALLTAYQADALGSVTESVSVATSGRGNEPPLPFLNFQPVSAAWW